MYFTFSCGGTQKCVQIGRKWIKILCFLASQKAGLRTACVWKMLIIPPPLATALHRSSHMLLYKLFTYNGGLYWAATRLFRIQIKRLDFRLPRAKEGICVDTKGLSLPHYLLCLAGQASEGSFWPEPLSLRSTESRTGFADSSSKYLSWSTNVNT